MQEKKIGRPTVMTPEVIKAFEDNFFYGMTPDEAIAKVGISRSKFYDYQSKNPDWAERLEMLRKMPKAAARVSVVKSFMDENGDVIDSPNVEMAFKFLERTARDEFGVSQKLEHTGEVTLHFDEKDKDA